MRLLGQKLISVVYERSEYVTRLHRDRSRSRGALIVSDSDDVNSSDPYLEDLPKSGNVSAKTSKGDRGIGPQTVYYRSTTGGDIRRGERLPDNTVPTFAVKSILNGKSKDIDQRIARNPLSTPSQSEPEMKGDSNVACNGHTGKEQKDQQKQPIRPSAIDQGNVKAPRAPSLNFDSLDSFVSDFEETISNYRYRRRRSRNGISRKRSENSVFNDRTSTDMAQEKPLAHDDQSPIGTMYLSSPNIYPLSGGATGILLQYRQPYDRPLCDNNYGSPDDTVELPQCYDQGNLDIGRPIAHSSPKRSYSFGRLTRCSLLNPFVADVSAIPTEPDAPMIQPARSIATLHDETRKQNGLPDMHTAARTSAMTLAIKSSQFSGAEPGERTLRRRSDTQLNGIPYPVSLQKTTMSQHGQDRYENSITSLPIPGHSNASLDNIINIERSETAIQKSESANNFREMDHGASSSCYQEGPVLRPYGQTRPSAKMGVSSIAKPPARCIFSPPIDGRGVSEGPSMPAEQQQQQAKLSKMAHGTSSPVQVFSPTAAKNEDASTGSDNINTECLSLRSQAAMLTNVPGRDDIPAPPQPKTTVASSASGKSANWPAAAAERSSQIYSQKRDDATVVSSVLHFAYKLATNQPTKCVSEPPDGAASIAEPPTCLGSNKQLSGDIRPNSRTPLNPAARTNGQVEQTTAIAMVTSSQLLVPSYQHSSQELNRMALGDVVSSTAAASADHPKHDVQPDTDPQDQTLISSSVCSSFLSEETAPRTCDTHTSKSFATSESNSGTSSRIAAHPSAQVSTAELPVRCNDCDQRRPMVSCPMEETVSSNNEVDSNTAVSTTPFAVFSRSIQCDIIQWRGSTATADDIDVRKPGADLLLKCFASEESPTCIARHSHKEPLTPIAAAALWKQPSRQAVGNVAITDAVNSVTESTIDRCIGTEIEWMTLIQEKRLQLLREMSPQDRPKFSRGAGTGTISFSDAGVNTDISEDGQPTSTVDGERNKHERGSPPPPCPVPSVARAQDACIGTVTPLAITIGTNTDD